MKTFDTFDRRDGWASAAEAFREDFAAGHRIQIAPWGGYAILGHAELSSLARNPLADGMAPDRNALADTPEVYDLLCRALFTKSGEAHRHDRSATVAAFNRVPLTSTVRALIKSLPPEPQSIDLRSGLVAPLVRGVWAAIIGLNSSEALRLEAAVRDLGHVVSLTPDPAKACLAERAAVEVRALSYSALDAGSAFTQALRAQVGSDRAVDLIAGMAFDAIDTATIGLDAALRVAFVHRDWIKPTMQCADECLRLASPTPMTMRLTTGEIALGDVTLDAGTVLSMIWPAGNHDPLAFESPANFDPARGGARALTFGAGQHGCVGHALMRTMLTELIGVLGVFDLEYDGPLHRWCPLTKNYLPPVSVRISG